MAATGSSRAGFDGRGPFTRFVTEQLRRLLENRSIRFGVLGSMLVVASAFSLTPSPFGLDPSWMFILPVVVAAVAGGLREGLFVAISAAFLGAAYVAAQQGGLDPVIFAGVAAARLALLGTTAAILGSFAEAHHSVQKNWQTLAALDPLTKLANITTFYEEMEVMRQTSTRFALLVVDIDDLKGLNDRYGHQAGSAAIQAVARSLRRSVRGADLVARFGGDEYVVILRATDRAGAQIVINRISEELSQEILPQALEWRLSVSVGVSLFEEDGQTVEDLLTVADEAMYANKRARKAAPARG